MGVHVVLPVSPPVQKILDETLQMSSLMSRYDHATSCDEDALTGHHWNLVALELRAVNYPKVGANLLNRLIPLHDQPALKCAWNVVAYTITTMQQGFTLC